MYLINSKTGKPVEVTDEDLKGYGSGEKPKRSSFGARPKSKDDQTDRPSKLPQRTFETEEAPAQDGVPEITRSSDYALAVMESIQVEQDYGAYQIAERAAFRFGEETFCRVLIQELSRLIETLPDWAGEFLVSIANGQNTIQQSTIDNFNRQLSQSLPDVRSVIQAFITKEE